VGPILTPAARRFVEHVNQLAYDARQEFAKPQIAAPTPDLPSAPVAPTSKNAADALRELASLRETGIVNDAEYEAKKAELLGRL
jgi:hypothetical protein